MPLLPKNIKKKIVNVIRVTIWCTIDATRDIWDVKIVHAKSSPVLITRHTQNLLIHMTDTQKFNNLCSSPTDNNNADSETLNNI